MPFFKKEQKAINDKWYPPVPADLKSSYSHPWIVNPGGRGSFLDSAFQRNDDLPLSGRKAKRPSWRIANPRTRILGLQICKSEGARGDEMDEDRMPFSCFIIGRLRS